MHRRSLLWAGAGLAVGATDAKAADRTDRGSPSVFEFGAKGDGTTDDSAAFARALQHAAAGGRVVTVPSCTYAIARPIVFKSANHVGRAWGLACQGATLSSRINTGESVLSIASRHIVRYLRIAGGLTVTGNGGEGNGIHLFAPGGGPALYNALLEGVAVEKVGGHGLLFEGNVFESLLLNCFFQDCGKNGATFAHSKGGVCSAISTVGCFFNQNGNHGLAATNRLRLRQGVAGVDRRGVRARPGADGRVRPGAPPWRPAPGHVLPGDHRPDRAARDRPAGGAAADPRPRQQHVVPHGGVPPDRPVHRIARRRHADEGRRGYRAGVSRPQAASALRLFAGAAGASRQLDVARPVRRADAGIGAGRHRGVHRVLAQARPQRGAPPDAHRLLRPAQPDRRRLHGERPGQLRRRWCSSER